MSAPVTVLVPKLHACTRTHTTPIPNDVHSVEIVGNGLKDPRSTRQQRVPLDQRELLSLALVGIVAINLPTTIGSGQKKGTRTPACRYIYSTDRLERNTEHRRNVARKSSNSVGSPVSGHEHLVKLVPFVIHERDRRATLGWIATPHLRTRAHRNVGGRL